MLNTILYTERRRDSSIPRKEYVEEFASDRSRIVFCSSFRRMMQKAQVFSLEKNTSVRNRLTHSLEVADIGKLIARSVGNNLIDKNLATVHDVRCLESIVENACLIHDIGNPPFGHFGEEAIKKWFSECAPNLHENIKGELKLDVHDSRLFDFLNFDGNPQGFRIVNRLHTEFDQYGLNLTYSSLLASVKYPCYSEETKRSGGFKKLGVFTSEADIYKEACNNTGHKIGKRYFAVYLMELADDICYCLSDIGDAFEKRIIDSRLFKEELKKIFKDEEVEWDLIKNIIPTPITSFQYEVAMKISQECVTSAVNHFVKNFDSYVAGEAKEIIDVIDLGKALKCLKKFSRRFIYTAPEAQKIEIAGHRIVHELLEHYGMLLKVDNAEFSHFITKNEMRKDSGLDLEWRVFNQLSKRMLKSYQHNNRSKKESEWFARCRLISDYVSGMTDQSALQFYQNAMGISLEQ